MTPEERKQNKREYLREYFQKNKERMRLQRLESRRKAGVKEFVRTGLTRYEYKLKWVGENPDYIARQSEYNRSEARRARRKELYRLESLEQRAAREACSSARRARKANAMPAWLSKADVKTIQAIYQMAARISKCMGVPHEVDHIVPIAGKTVCGLHVPWNLAVIPASINRRKGNRFTVDQSLNYGKLPCLSQPIRRNSPAMTAS